MSVDLKQRVCEQPDCETEFLQTRRNQRFCSKACLNRRPRTPVPASEKTVYSKADDRSLEKRRDRWSKNGWTYADYQLALLEQDGRCAICGVVLVTEWEGRKRGPTAVSADHCHATGVKRALLCSCCNTGLGHFRDNPESLVKAAAYIIKYREESERP